MTELGALPGLSPWPGTGTLNRMAAIKGKLIVITGGAGGTVASYHWDIPCGPAIVMACLAIFLGTLIAGKLRRQCLAWQN
jgi:ABC-type Mn2+/Zn2+ transport system permease subunit